MKRKIDISPYHRLLSHLAFDSKCSLGRRYSRKNDEDSSYYFLDPFYLDIKKIQEGKSFRRLGDKTQVFPVDLHSNIRNRLIHTNEVVRMSSLLASILGLNVYLAEAIACGHDIGHTPFGHLGERLISDLSGRKFAHHVNSVVVAQKVERKGKGLNLTYETLEGMLNHSRGGGDMVVNSKVTAEATVVMYADKISYTFSDLNDAIRVGYLNEKRLPKIAKQFGKNQRERNELIVFALVKESVEEGMISFSKSEVAKKFSELKRWMYENVYYVLDTERHRVEIYDSLKEIATFVAKNFNGAIDPFFAISTMTDREVREFSSAICAGGEIDLHYGFNEIIQSLSGANIDIFDPDLSKKNFSRNNL